jgi:hypothetical protein
MQELGDTATASLIDSVIFVGVPQSGAPRAVAALLFGDGESLPGSGIFPEILMTAAHARTFSLTAPMVYHLLPSALYFADVYDPLHPLVSIGSGALLAHAREVFGTAITSYDALLGYLRGDDGRTAPKDGDLRNPAVVPDTLLTYAGEEHARLDPWTPPAGVSVYQIAGWGVDTISGVELYEQAVKTLKGISSRLAYRPQFVEDGDGTVPVPSALMMNETSDVHRYWVDIPGLGDAYNHGTLFQIPDVEDLVASIIQGAPHLSGHVTTEEPQTLHPLKKLLFVLHDPAELAIEDSHGGHMSITPSGAVSNSLLYAQANVLGEDEYALVPSGDRYSVHIAKPETGSLTLDVEEMIDGAVTASSTLASAATPETTLQFSIESGIEDMSPVQIDMDGDGQEEISVPLVLGDTVFSPDTTSSGPHREKRAVADIPVATPRVEGAAYTAAAPFGPIQVKRQSVQPKEKAIAVSLPAQTQPKYQQAPAALTPSWIHAHLSLLVSWLRRIWQIIF